MADTWEWGPWASQGEQYVADQRKRDLQAQKDAADLVRQNAADQAASQRQKDTEAGALARLLKQHELNRQDRDYAAAETGTAVAGLLSRNPELAQKYGEMTKPAGYETPPQLTQPVDPAEDPEAAAYIPRTQGQNYQPAQYRVSPETGRQFAIANPKFLEEAMRPPSPPKAPEPFTLGKDQIRFDPNGNVIARGPDATVSAEMTMEQAQAQAAILNKANPNAFAGIASNAKGGWHVVQHPPTASMQGEQLSGDALDSAAQYYNQTGSLPPGMSRNVQSQRQIMNRAAQLRAGMPGDFAVKSAGYKADVAALSNLSKQEALVNSFERNAEKNAIVALGLSNKVDRTGVPVFNRWLLAGRSTGAGDPDVAAFNAATETFTNEYAKIMSSATGSGVTSDEARRHARDMLNNAMTQDQYNAVVGVMRQDMGNRRAGYAEEKSAIRSRIGVPNTSPNPVEDARTRAMNKYNKGNK